MSVDHGITMVTYHHDHVYMKVQDKLDGVGMRSSHVRFLKMIATFWFQYVRLRTPWLNLVKLKWFCYLNIMHNLNNNEIPSPTQRAVKLRGQRKGNGHLERIGSKE